MIHKDKIITLIQYFTKEAKEYGRLGGMNEAWGLIHAAKKLQKLLLDEDRGSGIENSPKTEYNQKGIVR